MDRAEMVELATNMLKMAEGKELAVVILIQDNGDEGLRVANVAPPYANDMMRSSLEHSSISVSKLVERMES